MHAVDSWLTKLTWIVVHLVCQQPRWLLTCCPPHLLRCLNVLCAQWTTAFILHYHAFQLSLLWLLRLRPLSLIPTLYQINSTKLLRFSITVLYFTETAILQCSLMLTFHNDSIKWQRILKKQTYWKWLIQKYTEEVNNWTLLVLLCYSINGKKVY